MIFIYPTKGHTVLFIPIRIQIKTFERSGIIPSKLSFGSIVDV